MSEYMRRRATEELPEEERLKLQELAEMTLFMQRALGADSGAREYIDAYIEALRGETELPVVEDKIPNIFAFAAPIQAFEHYNDEIDNIQRIHDFIYAFPGAKEARDAYIAEIFPNLTEDEIKVWQNSEHPEDTIPRYDIAEATERMLNGVNREELEKAAVTQRIMFRPEVRETPQTTLERFGLTAPSATMEKKVRTREMVEAPGMAGFGIPAKEIPAFEVTKEKWVPTTKEEIAAETRFQTIESSGVMVLATFDRMKEDFPATKYSLEQSYDDIAWGVEGIFNTYLSGLSLVDTTNYFGGGAKGVINPATGEIEITATGTEGWIERATEELFHTGQAMIGAGETEGFAILSEATIGEFFRIANTYPRITWTMNVTDQLDLLRNVPREATQTINDVGSYILSHKGVRGNALAKVLNERGTNLGDILDQGFAEAATRIAPTLQRPEPLDIRLGAPAMPRAEAAKMAVGTKLMPILKGQISDVLFPEKTYVSERAVVLGERGFPEPEFIPRTQFPQVPTGAAPEGYRPAIEFIFPPSREGKAEVPTIGTPKRLPSRMRKPGFPITTYRRAKY